MVYSQSDIQSAVQHFINNGGWSDLTVHELGYPTEATLVRWVKTYARDYVEPWRPSYATLNAMAHINAFAATGRSNRYALSEIIHDIDSQTHATLGSDINVGTYFSEIRMAIDLKKTLAAVDPQLKGPLEEFIREKEAQIAELEVRVTLLEKRQLRFLKLSEKMDDLMGKLEYSAMQVDLLVEMDKLSKKAQGANANSLTNREKTRIVSALRNKHKLKDMLGEIKLSKSAYFRHRAQLNAPDKDEEKAKIIRKVFEESRCRYGYRRIQYALKRQGKTIAARVIKRIMKKQGMQVYMKKRRKYSSYCGEVSPHTPNVINRNFHADQPNKKWLTDITEVSIPVV